MRRILWILVIVVGLPMLAWAGSPHMTTCSQTISGTTISVDGKEAGLGDETQVHLVLSATAQCINPGGNHPQAGNKTSVSAEGSFPVQNGRALFDLTATATFQPACSPPMDVVFTDVTVCDVDHPEACCSF